MLNTHEGELFLRNSKQIWQTTREIVKVNGVAGLWRGTTATLLRYVSLIT